MTECEEENICATWTFLGTRGSGQWQLGSVANLAFETAKVNDDRSISIIVRRFDATGSTAGLTATYNGTWRNGILRGDYISAWAGHWEQKKGNWRATIQAPVEIPKVLHMCEDEQKDCVTFKMENGRYTNYTNLPYQSGEERILNIESFTRDLVKFWRVDHGNRPLTALMTGKISVNGNSIFNGTIQFRTFMGGPTNMAHFFSMTWGSALYDLPGSEGQDDTIEAPIQPEPLFTGEDPVSVKKWMKFWDDVTNSLQE